MFGLFYFLFLTFPREPFVGLGRRSLVSGPWFERLLNVDVVYAVWMSRAPAYRQLETRVMQFCIGFFIVYFLVNFFLHTLLVR